MQIQRRILVQAILVDNKLIPLWDSRVTYEKDGYLGKRYIFEKQGYSSIVECIFDTKTKELSPGIEVNYYPPVENSEFKINDYIMHDIGSRKLTKKKIADIVYRDFSVTILKGKDLKDYPYYMKVIKEAIISDHLYSIKHWKSVYVLDDGYQEEWSHKLFHIV